MLEFAEDFLKNIANVWEIKDFSVKTRFQWFAFREGLIYDFKNLRITKICTLFKLKEIIEESVSSIVLNREIKENTFSTINLLPSAKNIFENKEFWMEIGEELQQMKDIFSK